MNAAGGGAALSTLGLIDYLRASGVASSIVCHPLGSPAEREQLAAAVEGRILFTTLYWLTRKTRSSWWKRPIHEVLQWWQTGFIRRSTGAVTCFAKQQQADLVHTNTINNPEGAGAARRLHLPHVWHLRELLGPGQPFRVSFEGARFARYVQPRCSKLVANSNATAALVRDWLPGDWLEVVPNGIDLSRFTLRSSWTRPEPLVVGMVANLTSRWKNHRLLIDAAAHVDRALPIEYRFYGHDPSRAGASDADPYLNELHAAIRMHGLNDRFRFAGHRAAPEQIMAELDILAHPTESESFGRIAVEAMAAGVPVVGIQGGGVGEIVVAEETGLLAAPNSPVELARHIERLARDPALREKFGKAGRRRAEQCYSLFACGQKVMSVYRQAMTRPVGSNPPCPQ